MQPVMNIQKFNVVSLRRTQLINSVVNTTSKYKTWTWAVAGRNFIWESTSESAVLSSSIFSSIDSFLSSPLASFNKSAMLRICLFFRYSSTWGYLSLMSFMTSWNCLTVSVPELSLSAFLKIAAISSWNGQNKFIFNRDRWHMNSKNNYWLSKRAICFYIIENITF